MSLRAAIIRKHKHILAASACLTMALPAQAAAQEVFAGVAAHEVDTPFTLTLEEEGVDFQIGYRSEKIEALDFIGKPEAYVFVSVNSEGDTSLAAAGLSWTLGEGTFYFRPGIGLAIHDGPSRRFRADGLRTDLGSRILFEPEIAVGARVSERISVEASWVHVSHATLFSGQNPGLDVIGIRINYGL